MKAEEMPCSEHVGRMATHRCGLKGVVQPYAPPDNSYCEAEFCLCDLHGDPIVMRTGLFDGWAWDEPPQPKRHVEEWAVGLDDLGCHVVKVPGAYPEGDCLLSCIGDHLFTACGKAEIAEWLDYYIYILPNGERVESYRQRLIYNEHTGRCREPLCHPRMRDVRDILLTPTAVPMLVEGE